MGFARFIVFGVMTVTLGSVGVGSPALAQTDTPVVGSSELDLVPPTQDEARIAELERAYHSVNLAGPRAGVGVSTLLVSGGVTAIVTGALVRSFETTFFCPPDDPRCGDPSGGSAAIIAVGVAAVIGGAVSLTLTSRKLRRRKEERRRIRWEIDRLQGTVEGPYQPRPSWY